MYDKIWNKLQNFPLEKNSPDCRRELLLVTESTPGLSDSYWILFETCSECRFQRITVHPLYRKMSSQRVCVGKQLFWFHYTMGWTWLESTEDNCGHCLAVLRDSSKERRHVVLQSKGGILDSTEDSLTVRCLVYNEDEIERVCTVISINGGKSRSVKQEFTLANV